MTTASNTASSSANSISSTATASLSSSGNSATDGHRTLVITLSAVLGSVGLVLVIGAVLFCLRYRRRRFLFFARGITPIDDDEIATWKISHNEKAVLDGVDEVPPSSGSQHPLSPGTAAAEASGAVARSLETEAGAGTRVGTEASITKPRHVKHGSTSSVKKPPSVIVYSNPEGQGLRRSEDTTSPRKFSISSPGGSAYGGRISLEKDLPQTPIQARAPNARAGLTDEAIPGDDPFIPGPRRQPSRLSKLPPTHLAQHSAHAHARTRSSRSSLRSFAEYGWAGSWSDAELSPRRSHEHMNARHSAQQQQHHHRGGGAGSHSHSRVYSSSSIPPRLSLDNEGFLNGGLSTRPGMVRDEDIGRAIG